MLDQIKQTKAFQELPKMTQDIISMRASRIKIEDAIKCARLIGLEKWRGITPLEVRLQKIVEEIVI